MKIKDCTKMIIFESTKEIKDLNAIMKFYLETQSFPPDDSSAILANNIYEVTEI